MVALRVLVLQTAIQDVRYGLEASVRVIRRADRFVRAVLHWPQMVEQQKGVEIIESLGGERAPHTKAAAFDRTHAVQYVRHGAGLFDLGCHDGPPGFGFTVYN
jgi:hypothetical protein